MNEKEIYALIDQLRQQFRKINKNASEEEIDKMILDVFFQAYVEDEMDRDDLRTLTNALGYETNEDVLDQVDADKRNRK